ncbi:Fe2+-dependent dioxygenase [Acinetobacter boissieri]|uniref:PKHD-type hydroxylase n=1 Tax=Acinetobacter boissieri TaxID=1219383 RepID=A0A1G6J7W6_9GAMM|nr:Fe2+-dependent dioxygenase [Acinetobacter boissieri]SDC14777.1 PKHD-type hydroxylase [Acinetobacter boissieri]
MLIQVPNLLTLEQINECRTLLETAPWVDGKHTTGHQSAQIKNNLQLPIDCEDALHIGKIITQAFQTNPTAFSASLPKTILPPMFNCYQNGGHFGTHIDNAIRPHPVLNTYMRTDVSCTLFFTNPDEYDGGELIIEDTYGTQSVKLNAGDAILYPSTSLHEVTPVTRGARVSSFFWIQSFVASDIQRRMLFELDQSIQSLTQQLGSNHEDVVQLTGIYHNLLRQWSDM